jgi:ankyrin repeat protein
MLLKGIVEGDDRIEYLDEWNHTALYFAITHSNKEIVKILLEKGANPDTSDERGDPALLTA